MVCFYYSKTFLTIPNNLLYFSGYELICNIFGNNNLIWKLQFRHVSIAITDAFQEISNEFSCKPNKIWENKGSIFY